MTKDRIREFKELDNDLKTLWKQQEAIRKQVLDEIFSYKDKNTTYTDMLNDNKDGILNEFITNLDNEPLIILLNDIRRQVKSIL